MTYGEGLILLLGATWAVPLALAAVLGFYLRWRGW